MTDCAPKWRLFLLLLASILLAGCSQLRRPTGDEEREPHVIEGRRRLERLDYDGAIQSFERALQANPANSVAHLEVALLYEERKADYAAAIVHYQRHLLYRTNSPMVEVVKQHITRCTQELAKTVPYAVATRDVQRDLERYAQTNALLKRRVDLLEAELARRPQYVTNFVTNFVAISPEQQRGSSRLTRPTEPLAMVPEEHEPVPDPAPAREAVEPAPQVTSRAAASRSKPEPRERRTTHVPQTAKPKPTAAEPSGKVHTVRPGETLAVLAAKYHVSLSALTAANPSAARGVRAGQKIVIPK